MAFRFVRHGRNRTVISGPEYRRATEWALSRLVDPWTKGRIRIDLNHRKPSGARAECEGIRHCDKSRPYQFTICISNQPVHRRKTLLKLLFHELAHVKQYVTGQLWDTVHTPVTVWKGRKYRDGKIVHEKQPWEVDACRHELRLWDEWEREFED